MFAPAPQPTLPSGVVVRGAGAPIPDRPPVELPPLTIAPGGQSGRPLDDLPTELETLAALLAEVVMLAGDRAVFPSRWTQIAELALEQESVRRALRADGPAS
jgi:hypothetical protein